MTSGEPTVGSGTFGDDTCEERAVRRGTIVSPVTGTSISTISGETVLMDKFPTSAMSHPLPMLA